MQPDVIRRYLVLSVLMFWSSVISMALASLYLVRQRMSEFSNVTLLPNVLAVRWYIVNYQVRRDSAIWLYSDFELG